MGYKLFSKLTLRLHFTFDGKPFEQYDTEKRVVGHVSAKFLMIIIIGLHDFLINSH